MVRRFNAESSNIHVLLCIVDRRASVAAEVAKVRKVTAIGRGAIHKEIGRSGVIVEPHVIVKGDEKIGILMVS